MQKVSSLLLAAACLQTAWAATLNVPAGGDLQTALNAAKPGDTVVLAAGATYVGHFYLAPNPGPQWITIQSSAMGSLPPVGARVAMSDAPAMPKLVTPDDSSVLVIGTGANYYRIQGVEFAPAAGVYAEDLIHIGFVNEASNAQLAHDLDFDRDYIHGDPITGSKRGIALNGGATTVENSYISSFISPNQDTQALCGWNGPGPYIISNNYLEAGSEIVAFGGANVSIPLNVPSDITIKNNTFFKPLSWRAGDPSYAGIPVFAKNHIELKNARRVTIDGNTFTNNWVGADQQGFVMVFGVRTEGGAVPWAVVNDVTVRNNIIRHAAAGLLMMGRDGIGGSAARFVIQNNLWEDLRADWGGDGRLFQIQQNVVSATIDHNTAFENGWLAAFAISYSFNINFTNNIFNVAAGVIGPDGGVGTSSLQADDIGGIFTNNVMIGFSYYPYPNNNFFSSSISQVGFINPDAENFSLAANSPYKGTATDGTDPGAQLQLFGVQATSPVPVGWVNIISKDSGKCLDVEGVSTAPGARIHQWTCLGADNQKFQFTPVSGGYKVTAKNSGLQWDVSGGPGATYDGAPLIQYPYWGGTNETFQINPTADGYYTLNPASSGKCLDVEGVSKSDGAYIHQWSCTGSDNQKWALQAAQ